MLAPAVYRACHHKMSLGHVSDTACIISLVVYTKYISIDICTVHFIYLVRNISQISHILQGFFPSTGTVISSVHPKTYAHGLCFAVVWCMSFYPYPSGLLHSHWGNLMIAPVPVKQPWRIWQMNHMNLLRTDDIMTTKQSVLKRYTYLKGYTIILCLDGIPDNLLKPGKPYQV